MAARSSLAAKRRLSLDILADSRFNENNKVWTAYNRRSETNIQNFSNTFPSLDQHKSHLYEKKNKEIEKLSKDKIINTNVHPASPTSETHKTWLHKFLSWRYFMVLLLQSSFVVTLFLRNCLPMAMVCMTRPGSSHSSSLSSIQRSNVSFNESDTTDDHGKVATHGPELVSTNSSVHSNNGQKKDTEYEFEWNSEVQGLVLTSIMFSSFIGPVVASIAKEYLGSKLTLSITNLLSTILTFLSPLAARISPYCLVTIRMLLGVTLGGNVAVIGECLAWWAPHDEKLTMTALTFTGANIGSVLAAALSGYLCLVPLDNGWPFVFYAFGTLSVVWGIIWHFLSSPKPEEHPYISDKEKQYIISHRIGMDTPIGSKKHKPPYRKILTSIPVLAFFVTGIFHFWSTQLLFTYLPVFFNKFLRFPVQETGLLVSLTSLFRMLGSFFWTAVGNKTATIIGTNKSRKMCICTGFGLGGITTLVVGIFDETYKWVILALLIFVMINQSVGSSTIVALPLDMAPRYSGLLTGMFVSMGTLFAISGPLLTASITADGTQEGWRTVWIIMGTAFITGATVFLLFGQASLLPWAQGKGADAPHIVSPFVTLGRRFSTFLEAPPLSPVTTMTSGFDFSQHLQTQTTNVLSQLSATTPDIFYTGHFQVGQPNVPQVIVESSEEIDESYSSDDEVDVKDESPQSEERPTNPVRKRAFSEFGLEVGRRIIADEVTVEDLDREQYPLFKQLNETRDNQISFENELSDQSLTLGNVNKAFEDTEGESVVHSDDIEITRL